MSPSSEYFEAWVPVEGIPISMSIEAIHDDYEGFRILMRGGKSPEKVMKVGFDSHVLYRCADEGDRLRLIKQLPESAKGFLYTVKNSSLVQWLGEETYEMRSPDEMLHFIFACSNDIIDVVALEPPVIEWL